MNRKSPASFLEDMLGVLVQHFGIERVQAVLTKISNTGVELLRHQPQRPRIRAGQPINPSITIMLEELRQKDATKYRILKAFYADLKDRKVLPESQDIRQFAQLIGLKEIRGKSRKDLLPRLMRFLLEQPTERLRLDVERAATVSEQQRQQGFSVLTDKLLGDK
jgi:hypothetical protein